MSPSLQRFVRTIAVLLNGAGFVWGTASTGIQFYFRRSRLSVGVHGIVEWSHDLKQWRSDGLTIDETPSERDYTYGHASLTEPTASPICFFRLRVERQSMTSASEND